MCAREGKGGGRGICYHLILSPKAKSGQNMATLKTRIWYYTGKLSVTE